MVREKHILILNSLDLRPLDLYIFYFIYINVYINSIILTLEFVGKIQIPYSVLLFFPLVWCQESCLGPHSYYNWSSIAWSYKWILGKRRPVNPFFTYFKGFQVMSPKRRSGYISGTISTSLGNFVLGLGLDVTKKYINLLTYLNNLLTYLS